MTKSEKQIFDRIFADLSSQAGHESKPPRKSVDVGDLNGDESFPGTPQQLSDLFEHAIQQVEAANPTDAQTRGKSTVTDESTATQDILGWESLSRQEEEELWQRCLDYKEALTQQFEQPQTDVELWRFLEKEIFSLLPHLEAYRRRARSTQSKDINSRRRISLAGGEGVSRITSHIGRDEGVAIGGLPPPSEPPIYQTAMLATFAGRYYGDLCTRAMREFRYRFAFSPYALNVLPHIKSLGPISSVMGLSTPLYNEVIYQHFVQYRDYVAIADTFEEMENQGLQPDLVTHKLLRSFMGWHINNVYAKNGQMALAWSRIGAVQDGVARVRKACEAVERQLEREFKRSKSLSAFGLLQRGDDVDQTSPDEQDDGSSSSQELEGVA